jgi:diguanylate cyclase (GGDEF)-like protein/PAS domain S-box-containing protein
VDYQGTPVLVAGKPVPGTPWHLLIKMDEEEVLAELTRLIINTSIMAALAFMMTFAVLHILWQRQRLQQAVSEAKLTRQVKESEENYRAIFTHSNVPNLVIDPVSHEILSANEAAASFYGYSAEQLRQLNINALSAQSPEQMDDILIQVASEEKNRFEDHHRLANGKERTVEVFFAPLVFDGIYRIFAVIIDVTERKRLEQKLQEMATTDSLTKLPNRRHFMERLHEQLNLLARGISQHSSIMMIDLDHFKSINDTFGHSTGDLVLQQVAQLMREQLRKVDIPGRLGGEEFAILLPGVGTEEARVSAERLRLAIANNPRILNEGDELYHSISIGISEILTTDTDIKIPLARADKALYQAKQQGRNQVIIADSSWT